MIAALYVETSGAYFGIDDVDPWDERRDARLYAGPHAVVAHPPCSTWCQLARVNEKRYGHRVGDDAGCFASALHAVRTWGGVLEHPAESIAWQRFGLLRPVHGAWSRAIDGAWVCEVHQRAYGHRARKATWLYAYGVASLPSLDWSSPAPVATVSFLTNHGGGSLPRLSKREAKATPPAFRDLLLGIARSGRPLPPEPPVSAEGSGVKRYVVRCDCCVGYGAQSHYRRDYDGIMYWDDQRRATRYTLTQARRIVADGPGLVVRLVPRKVTR